MICPKCGIDSDKTTSEACLCSVLWILCSCGRYYKEGELHYHINEYVK